MNTELELMNNKITQLVLVTSRKSMLVIIEIVKVVVISVEMNDSGILYVIPTCQRVGDD